MLLGDGDGFVSCRCGRRHWGRNGAAGLLLTDPHRGVLLQHRAGWTHQGRTWALPGGAVLTGETAARAATRETEEETTVPAAAVRVLAERADDHGDWCYTTVLATVRTTVEARVANAESEAVHWVRPEDVPSYPLHGDFAAAWPRLWPQLDRELRVVVDTANVVGARPDGWWHDRGAAAARLRDRLGALVRTGAEPGALGVALESAWRWWPRVTLVTEGAAAEVPGTADVEVRAAPADADGEIVRTVRELRADRPRDHVVVVTADRWLRDRARAEGCAVTGPAALWRVLDAPRRR